jgi:hypothetical protein
MPGNRRRPLQLHIGLLTIIAAAWTVRALACPYCPRTSTTLSEMRAQSDVVCLARFLSTKNKNNFGGQSTTFKVVQALPAQQPLKPGEQITIPIGVTAKVDDQFLLMGQLVGGEMEWSLPIPVDEIGSEVKYLLKAPSPERNRIERLAYFWQFLDSKIPLISNDAFGEFSRAEFREVEALVHILNRKQIRKWLEDPDQQLDVRRGFYGMLLGLCGNSDDALFLEKKIFSPIPADRNRLGIDGMMAGYAMLRGRPGLQKLIEQKVVAIPAELANDDPRIGELNDVRTTISFLWDYRRGQFSEDELRTAMRRFLGQERYAESAIVDLARWKDWASLDTLIAAYGNNPWDTRSAKEKVVAFVLSCLKDVAAKTDARNVAYAEKAQKFLNTLDPDFVQAVKQDTGGLSAVVEPVKNETQSSQPRE